MGRQVALKVLPAGIAADTKAYARFLREALAAGKLSHQNVVAVYSTGVEDTIAIALRLALVGNTVHERRFVANILQYRIGVR
jgi:serine/threonine-protein kinase